MDFSLSKMRVNVLECIRNGLTSQDTTQLTEICETIKSQCKTPIDSDVKQVIDTTFREMLQNFTKESQLQMENYENLLNYSIQTSRNELSSGNLPVMLLSDLFDCRTLDECERLFELVEYRVDVWKEDTFFKHVKNHVLRSCNDLLRRLSRSQNTIFCGRILVFLARFFPLFERSGLNLISEFNQENTTAFSVPDEGSAELMICDSGMNDGDGDVKVQDMIKLDYNFYRKFWQLQEFFRNPTICYNRGNWKQFQTYSNDVISTFASLKLDIASHSNFQGLGIDSDSDDQLYFAKYLTNRKLLTLQLSDSNFRRYILLQFIILFQYLTSSVRFKQENHVLSDEHNNWVKEMTEKVYSLIEQTPPNGKEMRKCIEHILKREEYWNNWKNEGCPELKGVNELCNIRGTYARKRKLGDELKAAGAINRVLIGNAELNRIWNLYPDNWEACKSKKRVFTPTVEKFFESALKGSAEQKQKICTDSDFSWRALRLLSHKSPHFFTPSNQMVKPVNSYLECVMEKLSKDFASGAQKNIHDIAIDDAEDISDDELLKNCVDDTNTVPNASTTPQTNHGYGNETPNGTNGTISDTILNEIAEKIKDQWQKVAPHIGIQDDEIKWISDNNELATDVNKAKHVLNMWIENKEPEDATLVNLQKAIDKSTLGINITE